MTQRFFILLCTMAWTLSLGAQTIVHNRPAWVQKLPPVSKKKNYYYRVTCAEAKTYQEAYVKAFATAALESAWKLGVAVDVNTDAQSLQRDISQAINVDNKQMQIPLNKVCEYVEEATTSMNIRIYVLWQVAKYGNVNPQFDEFCDCR